MLGGKRRGKRKPIQRDIGRPTPERLAKGDHLYIVVDNGALHMRDSPLDRAVSRLIVTKQQGDALNKYRHHWYHSGMQGRLGSMDLDRVFNDSPLFTGMPASEAQAFHRQKYREAVQCLGIRKSMVVEMVVCREQTLGAAGVALGWGSKSQAIAAATELLKESGDRLHNIWG